MSGTVVFLITFGSAGLGALAALGLDAFGVRRAALSAAVAGMGVAAVGGIMVAGRGVTTALVGTFQVGGPASMVFGVIALTGTAAVAGGWDDLRKRASGGSIAGLIAFGVLAAGATSAAIDLTTVLLAIETSAVCAYALVASARTSRSAEASMKYFVQGAVATGLFIFGLAALLGAVDSGGRYDTLAQAFAAPSPIFPALAGVGLVLSALTFKMGGAPFHSWAPDAYESAPPESAAFLASGQKLGAIAAASVFVSIVASGSLAPRLLALVLVLAVLSVLVGSLAALRQKSYRRLLGYAGVAQAGYALIAIALFAPPLAVFFGATYALAATGTFLSAAAFQRLRPEWDGSVKGLAGLGRQAPVLSGSLGVLLVSLAGIPPFLGFWAKLLVFGTAVNVAAADFASVPKVSWALGIAVAAGLIGSVVSLAYYGSILRSLFFDDSQAPLQADVEEAALSAEGVVEELAEAERGGQAVEVAGGSAGLVVVAIATLLGTVSIATLVFGTTAIYALFAAR